MESIQIFVENRFKEEVETISYSFRNPIRSHFTDQQAKNICSKMSNKSIRHFSQRFLVDESNIDSIELRYQIHYLANKALSVFGGEVLTFIYNLDNWTGDRKNVEIITPSLYRIYSMEPNFPKLDITSMAANVSFEVIFKRIYEKPLNDSPVATIRNYTSYTYSKISKEGRLIENFEKCVPEILIFMNCVNGAYSFKAGYDDDVCDICGRTLWDSVSVKYGRGPGCRRNYGNP